MGLEPPFANNAKDGALTVLVVPARSKAGPPVILSDEQKIRGKAGGLSPFV
jgi:hypothetical protein